MTSAPLLLAVDQGTSATKALLIDGAGSVVGGTGATTGGALVAEVAAGEPSRRKSKSAAATATATTTRITKGDRRCGAVGGASVAPGASFELGCSLALVSWAVAGGSVDRAAGEDAGALLREVVRAALCPGRSRAGGTTKSASSGNDARAGGIDEGSFDPIDRPAPRRRARCSSWPTIRARRCHPCRWNMNVS